MKTDVVQRVEHILKKAGFPFEECDIGVRCRFRLQKGREQTVEIEHVSQTPDGHQVIAFYSRCQRLRKGLFGQLSWSQAIRVLRFNSQLPVGHFCIKDLEGQRYLVVRATLILETMDQEEISITINALASLADQWEERRNKDEF